MGKNNTIRRRVVCLAVGALFFISACGAGSSNSVSTAPQANTTAYETGYDSTGEVYNEAQEILGEAYIEGYERETAGESKKIKTGSLSLETDAFDFVTEEIKNTAALYGGYVASFSVETNDGGSLRRYGDITIRIPAESYEAAKDYIMELGVLNNYSDSITNVTSEYNDIESRLTTKRAEEARLLAFIDKAEKIEDIIALEERLGQVRTEIELYEASLLDMDRKISYSTLNIAVQENTGPVIQPVSNNLSGRMAAGFQTSFRFVTGFLQGVVVILAYISVPAVIIGITAAAGIFVYKRTKK